MSNPIRASLALAAARMSEAPAFEKGTPDTLSEGNPVLQRQLANVRQALATFLDAPTLEKSLTPEEFVAQHGQDQVFDETGLERFAFDMLEKGVAAGLPLGAIEASISKAREGLVKKTITTKNGHTATRWVRANSGQQSSAAKPAAAAESGGKSAASAAELRAKAARHKEEGDAYHDAGDHETASQHYAENSRLLAQANNAAEQEKDAAPARDAYHEARDQAYTHAAEAQKHVGKDPDKVAHHMAEFRKHQLKAGKLHNHAKHGAFGDYTPAAAQADSAAHKAAQAAKAAPAKHEDAYRHHRALSDYHNGQAFMASQREETAGQVAHHKAEAKKHKAEAKKHHNRATHGSWASGEGSFKEVTAYGQAHGTAPQQ